MRIMYWSSDVCSSDLSDNVRTPPPGSTRPAIAVPPLLAPNPLFIVIIKRARMGALLDKCRSCSYYWTASQRLKRATHVDEACGPPVCIAPGRTMVNHFEHETREVLSRVEGTTVDAR